jgi:diacylglycerol diphosphate phosphatase / phosphatidate phosphatase
MHWVLLLLATMSYLSHFASSKMSTVLDGRKSFPSGHSSGAFAGMTFLSLWLAGKTAAWCFHSPSSVISGRTTRLGALSLTFIPLSWATFVALSRVEDYVSFLTPISTSCSL